MTISYLKRMAVEYLSKHGIRGYEKALLEILIEDFIKYLESKNESKKDRS